MRKGVKVFEDCLPSGLHRFFKRVAKYLPNGDVTEDFVEVSVDRYVEESRIGSSSDSFIDAVNRVPPVDMIGRFEAIERLSVAIAGIEFSNVSENEES